MIAHSFNHCLHGVTWCMFQKKSAYIRQRLQSERRCWHIIVVLYVNQSHRKVPGSILDQTSPLKLTARLFWQMTSNANTINRWSISFIDCVIDSIFWAIRTGITSLPYPRSRVIWPVYSNEHDACCNLQLTFQLSVRTGSLGWWLKIEIIAILQ